MENTNSLSLSPSAAPSQVPSPLDSSSAFAVPGIASTLATATEIPTVPSPDLFLSSSTMPSVVTVTIDGHSYSYPHANATKSDDNDDGLDDLLGTVASNGHNAIHTLDGRATRRPKAYSRKPADQAVTTTVTSTKNGKDVCSIAGEVYSDVSEWPPCETATLSAVAGRVKVPGGGALRKVVCALHGWHHVPS